MKKELLTIIEYLTIFFFGMKLIISAIAMLTGKIELFQIANVLFGATILLIALHFVIYTYVD